MNKLIIVGAGGHGKVVLDNALKNGYEAICFVDDNVEGEFEGFRIVGRCDDLETFSDGQTDFVLGIGSNEVRKNIAIKNQSLQWVSLIHPSAQIGRGVSLGVGTVVMAGAVVNADAKIGEHCIINSGAIVEHDNLIGDFVHISPRAALGGTVQVGACTHIGIAASVRNNVRICENCTVGVGAAVVKNIEISGIYVGVPARMKV